MIIKTDGTIGEAVALYTGRVVLELEIVQDPVVPHTVAIRAVLELDHISFFLVRGVPLQKIRAADLEDVVFTEWPPTSRL